MPDTQFNVGDFIFNAEPDWDYFEDGCVVDGSVFVMLVVAKNSHGKHVAVPLEGTSRMFEDDNGRIRSRVGVPESSGRTRREAAIRYAKECRNVASKYLAEAEAFERYADSISPSDTEEG